MSNSTPGGRGADVAIEVSSYATEPVAEALPYAASGARVVLAGEVPGEASVHSCLLPHLG